MKQIHLIEILFVMMIAQNMYTQDIVWPILNATKPGDGIIYRPQDYIGEEHNIEKLFITAPEGTEVITPVSGVILNYKYIFLTNLNRGYFYNVTDDLDMHQRDEISKSIWEKYKKKADPKNIVISLSIQTGQGEVYTLSGIHPVIKLKTGMRLNKGDVIGTIGHCYRLIERPSLFISRNINGQIADPMASFGLKTTFLMPEKNHNPNQKYTVTKLREDLDIFRQSVEEGHPGLYDYIEKHRLDSIFNESYGKINDGMDRYNFYKLIYSIALKIRDGHIFISPVSQIVQQKEAFPSITFSILNDILQVSRVTKKTDLGLIGKEIVAINGITSDELKRGIREGYDEKRFIQDGFIQSFDKVNRGIFFYQEYIKKYNPEKDEIILSFADGSQQEFPFIHENTCVNYLPIVKYHEKLDYDVNCKKLDEKTALIDINSFNFSEMDYDSIKLFVKDISNLDYENLIMDIRYNDGGNIRELFKFFANEPFQTFIDFKVNKNDTYDFFQYCSNYTTYDRNIFPDYTYDEGKKGFFISGDSVKLNNPSDSIHFAGRLYILTDERTNSAASLFAALVHKYKRGVIVGRETGTAYHHMNASKFANVILRNTKLNVRIPLVKCIFAYPENSDIPWGRGVLPDYPFELSIDELINDKDVMLEYTLQLIKENKYLKDAPTQVEALSKENGSICIIVCIISAITVLTVAIFLLMKKRNTNNKISIK